MDPPLLLLSSSPLLLSYSLCCRVSILFDVESRGSRVMLGFFFVGGGILRSLPVSIVQHGGVVGAIVLGWGEVATRLGCVLDLFGAVLLCVFLSIPKFLGLLRIR
jgi:hypothetical protein